MKRTIKITTTEYITVEVSRPIVVDTSYDSEYFPWEDSKWKKFCKDHNFNYAQDSHGKIYDLYLQMCAEGMI